MLSACGGAEPKEETPPPAPDAQPTTFKIRLENVAPFKQLKAGSFNTPVGATAPGPLKPGDAYEVKFTAGKGHKLSFAMMFGASNDWFFAPAAGGLDLYENGVPVSGDVTARVFLWNAGTEVDEEPGVGAHTGPNQATSTDGSGAADSDATVRRIGSTVKLASGATFNVPSVASLIKVTLTPTAGSRELTLRVENVADDSATLMTTAGAKPVRVSPGVFALTTDGEPLFSEGKPDRGLGLEAIAETGNVTSLAAALASSTGLATGVSPFVWVVHASGMPLFTVGEKDRGQGLENLAESGNVAVLSDALKATLPDGARDVGVVNMPVGKTSPGAIGPGGAYELELTAKPGDRLSFATMYGWSNDWFFATPAEGIALFDDAGMPLTGDRSGLLKLFDAGTEKSEEPAVGPNTGPQQASPTAGDADPDATVRELTAAAYPTAASTHLKLTISR